MAIDLQNAQVQEPPAAPQDMGIRNATEQFLALLGEPEAQGETGEPPAEPPAREEPPQTLPPEEITIPVAESDVAPQFGSPQPSVVASPGLEDIRNVLKETLAETQGVRTPEPPAPEEPPAPPFRDDEEFMEKFSGNALETLKTLIDSEAEKRFAEYKAQTEKELEPVRALSKKQEQRANVEKALIGFFTDPEFSDAQDMGGEITNFIMEKGLPADDPMSYERAYYKIKTGKLSGNRPLEDYLNDPEALKKIIEHPDVNKAAVEGYLGKLSSGEKPVVIGSEGLPQASPVTKISDFKQAREAMQKML
jgi:hypothetical protein